MKKNIIVIGGVVLVGCKSVPNYLVTNQGLKIYKRTKIGEPIKDILSNGDTLMTTKDSIYLIKKN